MTRVISSTLALARPKVPSYLRVSKSAKNKGFGHCFLTFFLASLRARLSLLLRSNSMMRRSYGARLSDTIVRSPCPIQLHAMLLEQKTQGREREHSATTYPATSLMSSRTKAVRLLRWPLVRLTRGLLTRGVVFCSGGKSRQRSAQSPSSADLLRDIHREDEASAEILHEVRQEAYLTWPLLRPC